MADSDDNLDARALALFEESLLQPSGSRRDWIIESAKGDDALKKRSLALYDADAAVSDSVRTGGAIREVETQTETAPTAIGRYRIVRLIGRGGMGAVYLGERQSGDFEHKVAIKVVRGVKRSLRLAERLRTERQTLAGLQHPNIAQLFDGGETADGAPYLIMEHVEGEPLGLFLENNRPSLPERVRIFREICSGVLHAHQNLIVHRDLAPNNVLITKAGAAKLIDFGISRSLSDIDGSAAAQLTMTKGYAAPEREQGEPSTTLSDIYSLGVILREMLAAAPPARDKDLEAIAGKASAARPEDRYESVDAIIADIDRYQAGRAVAARDGGGLYALGKFFRRHRFSAGIGAAAVFALVAAFSITLFEYARAEDALASANARFDQSRKLSKQLVFDVYDDIEQIAGTLDVRKKLADLLHNYVDELAADPFAPNDILMDVGVQYNRLSDLYGGVGISNLGETDLSYELLLKAEQSLKALLQRDPDNVEAIDEMVWTQRLLTNQELAYKLDVDAAKRRAEAAGQYAERGLALPGAEKTKLIDRYWNVKTDKLKILTWSGDQEAALVAARRYRQELAAPGLEEKLGGYDRKVAYFATQEGEILTDTKHGEEALEPLKTARSIYASYAGKNPQNYYFLMQTMRVDGLLSNAARQAGDGALSVSSARHGAALAEKIAALDPEDANGRQFVAAQYEQLAMALAAFGSAGEAKTAISTAIDAAQKLAEDFPDTASRQRDLASVQYHAGRIYGMIGEIGLQCPALKKAENVMADLMSGADVTGYDKETLTEAKALYAKDCASR